MDHWLGIDCGTGGIRAVALHEDGTVAGEGFAPIALYTPRPLWACQRPGDWWAAAVPAVRTATAGLCGPVTAVGVTGQMLGSVLLDEAGQALPECVIWMDQRAAAQRDEIEALLGDEILSVTANTALTSLWAPKLLWLRRHEPETYRRIHGLLFPKDYLKYRMTGVRDIDVTDAGGSMLFDTPRRRWADGFFDALGIPRHWVPEYASESTAVIGGLSRAAAAELGLAPGTPVVSGAGDQMAAAVASGAVTPGVVSACLGTSGVVFTTSPACVIDGQDRAALSYCHAVAGAWCLYGCTMAAGASYVWLRERVFPDLTYRQMDELAQSAPPGSGGAYFLPYLNGERTPHPDPNARGGFYGLDMTHGRAELCRAVLEGVAYSLGDVLGILREYGLTADTVRVSGGGARSPLWRQILADVLNARVLTTPLSEGPAAGAALLAAVGVGAFPTVREACAALVRITGETAPDMEAAAVYEQGYQTYRALYPALKGVFKG